MRGRQSQEPGKEAGWQQAQRSEPGCWSSVCGVSHSPHLSSLRKALHPLPKSSQNFPGTWALLSKLPHLPCAGCTSPISLPAPPPWCCLPGTVVGGQNVTARIGKPLVLNCKGAPKKPPQQLEWKLVSRAPVARSPPPCLLSPFPKGPSLSPEHRSDRSLEGPVSPGRPLGQRGSGPPQWLSPPASHRDPGRGDFPVPGNEPEWKGDQVQLPSPSLP